MAGGINLTQHLGAGTLIITSRGNHRSATTLRTHGDGRRMREWTEGELVPH